MFLSRNKKNNVYPCKPQFYYIKVGLRGSELYRRVFVMPPAPEFVGEEVVYDYLFSEDLLKAPYSSKIEIFFLYKNGLIN